MPPEAHVLNAASPEGVESVRDKDWLEGVDH